MGGLNLGQGMCQTLKLRAWDDLDFTARQLFGCQADARPNFVFEDGVGQGEVPVAFALKIRAHGRVVVAIATVELNEGVPAPLLRCARDFERVLLIGRDGGEDRGHDGIGVQAGRKVGGRVELEHRHTRPVAAFAFDVFVREKILGDENEHHNGFDAIRTDFTCITYGCYFAELVDAIASEGAANPEIFDLLQSTYQFLAQATDVPLLARTFELKFLDCAGYGPQLSRCAYCSALLAGKLLAFSVRHGGILCENCEYRDTSTVSLLPGSCALLKMLRKSELKGLNRIRASERNHRELKRALGHFIEYHTERKLKSLRFIERTL